MQNVGSGEAPSNELQAEALCADAPAAQQGCDMQPQLIAAQHQPHSPQQQVPQTLPPPTATTQPASRLPKPPPLVPQTQVEVIQPCHSQHSRHDQASGRQPVGQQQSQALSVASSGLVRNEDQYEVLRLQASLIPRQCHASLMVPSPSPLLPQPQQAAAQPHFVQSVTHSSAFAASGVSWQTPQAVSASQLASQQDSVTVRQNSGHAVTESRQQHRQHSMHHQVNDDGASRANHAPNAVYQQDQGVKVEQEKRYQGQQPGIVAGEGQLYGGPGPMAQQQPYTIAAMHQRHQAEHAVSRTADGASTTESHTVASSSSHYEFSFRHHSSNAALPSPGTL